MRVLVVVISDDSQPVYAVHRALWRKVTHPAFRVVFVTARPDITESILEGDVLQTPGKESFQAMLPKSIAAFDFFSNETQDFVIRTNLSSQFRWDRLLTFLETCPRERFQCGFLGNHNGIRFASGAGTYMTPDVVRYLLEKREEVLGIPELDDVAMGLVLIRAGFQLAPARRLDMITEHWIDPGNEYHVRLRNTVRREFEVEFRKRLIELDTNPSSQ